MKLRDLRAVAVALALMVAELFAAPLRVDLRALPRAIRRAWWRGMLRGYGLRPIAGGAIIEGGGIGMLLTNAGAPTAAVNEVQTITPSAAMASGTFRLAYEGQRTAALSFDVSAANMQTALNALDTIGTSGCSVALDGGTGIYTATFGGGNMAGLALPLMTVEDSAVLDAQAGAVTLEVAQSVAGVTATHRGASIGAVLADTTNGDLYVNSGTALVPVWTQVTLQTTASTTELNYLDDTVPGTAVASKVLALGATKNIDTLLFNIAAVAADGANQGDAAAITADTNFVTASDGAKGVKLPVAVAGRRIWIKNTVENAALLVYPNTDAAINAIAANSAITLPAGAQAMFLARTATQWYASAVPDGITASAAELNLLDTSVAGTAVASKAAVLGASKNLDILGLPVGGLKIGAAGAEVAITPTAAEINALAGVTAGTAAASSAVVLDANKRVKDIAVQHLVATASEDGAIAIAPGVVKITKAGVANLTLADPAAGDEGVVMIITAATANAHTVDNGQGGASGFNGGGAGSDVATFGGAIGDSMIICAIAQKWHAINLTNVTLG